MKHTSIVLIFFLSVLSVKAQDNSEYVKANAVRINNVLSLSDSVYNILNPFPIIMFGEMHGTNESVLFVEGLTNLFLRMGDSIQVGLEIPPSLMKTFLMSPTENNILKSEFFTMKPNSGKESTAWATLISKLFNNPKVQLFFFDVDPDDGKLYQRDSIMSGKISRQFSKHPNYKMITLTGNYHNRISGEPTTAFYLQRNKLKICSLNMEYTGGSCIANFGHGMQIKEVGSYPSDYNSTLSWDNFLLLTSPSSGYPYTSYPYNGFYYTRTITPATLTNSK
jgi:hypothetical protein